MLSDFILRHEIDVLSVQEVTSPEAPNIRGYDTHSNIGTTMRGTVILARNQILLTNVHKLPSGRGIAAEYGGFRFINVYAPSGTEQRTERASFFNSELPFLFNVTSHHMILEETSIVYCTEPTPPVLS